MDEKRLALSRKSGEITNLLYAMMCVESEDEKRKISEKIDKPKIEYENLKKDAE